jgi:hypothetical protein
LLGLLHHLTAQHTSKYRYSAMLGVLTCRAALPYSK